MFIFCCCLGDGGGWGCVCGGGGGGGVTQLSQLTPFKCKRNFKFMKLTTQQKKFSTCYIFAHQPSKYFSRYSSKPFIFQALVIVATIAAAAYCYYYFDNVHFHITHGYAHLGYAAAQHQIGQRYLNGMCKVLFFSVLENHSGTLSENVKNVACSDQRLWTLLCYCRLTDSIQNIAIIHKCHFVAW